MYLLFVMIRPLTNAGGNAKPHEGRRISTQRLARRHENPAQNTKQQSTRPAYNYPHQTTHHEMATPARVVRSAAASLYRIANVTRSPSGLSPLLRVVPRSQARCYVSGSGKKNAAAVSINVENRAADTQDFISKTRGLKPSEVSIGGGLTADAMMSPVAGNTGYFLSKFEYEDYFLGLPLFRRQYAKAIFAGILKRATIMDEGTRPIYLDMQATTPTDPRVLDAMLPYFTGLYGNPHSRTHAYGWETEKATEVARAHIARLIGADPKEIIFTSGATESNNMSIKGVARFYKNNKKHIITCQTEHKCVLDSCRHLEGEGFEVTYLPVQPNGFVDLKELEAAIRPDTALVSIMTVNNEIGVIQPMEAIGKLCRSRKVFFHTDGAQAVGKIPIDVNKMNIDLMSISGHKVYGPKGIGACYVRRRPRVRIEPLISGGGQERGLRSGTLAPPLVIGFGEACRIAYEELEVRDTLIHTLPCANIILLVRPRPRLQAL